MSLQESVNKLQNINRHDKYSICISPSLKDGQLQYQFKDNGYIKFVGSESEVTAFIAGLAYKEHK
jgi:hypothetical protein